MHPAVAPLLCMVLLFVGSEQESSQSLGILRRVILQAHEQDKAPSRVSPVTVQSSTLSSEGSFTKQSAGVDQGEPAQAFIPFSSGPRDCLGQRLAMMEVSMLSCDSLRSHDNPACIMCLLLHMLGMPAS